MQLLDSKCDTRGCFLRYEKTPKDRPSSGSCIVSRMKKSLNNDYGSLKSRTSSIYLVIWVSHKEDFDLAGSRAQSCFLLQQK